MTTSDSHYIVHDLNTPDWCRLHWRSPHSGLRTQVQEEFWHPTNQINILMISNHMASGPGANNSTWDWLHYLQESNVCISSSVSTSPQWNRVIFIKFRRSGNKFLSVLPQPEWRNQIPKHSMIMYIQHSWKHLMFYQPKLQCIGGCWKCNTLDWRPRNCCESDYNKCDASQPSYCPLGFYTIHNQL
jgi:hypothetical protein